MTAFLRFIAILWALLTGLGGLAMFWGWAVNDASEVRFFARSAGRLQQWQTDLATGVSLQMGDYPDSLLLAPDGQRAIFSERDTAYDLTDFYLVAANGSRGHLGTFSGRTRLNWSADGSTLLQTVRDSATERAAVYRIDPASGQRQTIGNYDWQPYRIDGSANGQQIALVDILYNSQSIGTVLLLHPERDEPLLIPGTSGVDWSRDGRWLAAVQAAQPPRHFSVIDPRTGERHPQIPNEIGGWYYGWSPDARFIIFEDRRGVMSRLMLDTGQTFALAEDNLRALLWSPSGRYEIRYIILPDDRTGILLRDLQTGVEHVLLTDIDAHGWRFYLPVWSADESRFGLRFNSPQQSFIILFDLQSGAQIGRYPAPSQRVYGFIQNMFFLD